MLIHLHFIYRFKTTYTLKIYNIAFTFLGQSDARCTVVIENDGVHEDPEEFRLVLGTPVSETAGKARIGDQDEILITIKDDADSELNVDPNLAYNLA